MSGKRQPGPLGGGAEVEDVDEGTTARIGMPAPLPAGATEWAHSSVMEPSATDAPMSGGIPCSVTQTTVVRIPVPGTDGICVVLRQERRGARGGSTSTVVFQDSSARRLLRLEHRYNFKSRTLDYHWERGGALDELGLADQAPSGRDGDTASHGTRYFRCGGRMLAVAGAAIEGVSIAQATRPLRRAPQDVARWAASWVGCDVADATTLAADTADTPTSPADDWIDSGSTGCILGGVGGYSGESPFVGEVYDWPESTSFTALPEAAGP